MQNWKNTEKISYGSALQSLTKKNKTFLVFVSYHQTKWAQGFWFFLSKTPFLLANCHSCISASSYRNPLTTGLSKTREAICRLTCSPERARGLRWGAGLFIRNGIYAHVPNSTYRLLHVLIDTFATSPSSAALLFPVLCSPPLPHIVHCYFQPWCGCWSLISTLQLQSVIQMLQLLQLKCPLPF